MRVVYAKALPAALGSELSLASNQQQASCSMKIQPWRANPAVPCRPQQQCWTAVLVHMSTKLCVFLHVFFLAGEDSQAFGRVHWCAGAGQ